MTIWTRKPEVEDALPLARMIDQAWRNTYEELFPPDFWDTYRTPQRAESVHASISDAAQRCLIAVADDTPVGWAVCGPSRASTAGIRVVRSTELYSLYVQSPGAGLGQRLLDELLGDEPAELWVFEANVRAQRFYERNGFRSEGTKHIYRPETAAVPEVRFVR